MEYGKPEMKMSTEGIVFKPEDFRPKTVAQHRSNLADAQERSSVPSSSKATKGKDKLKSGVEDPLAEFYAEAKAQTEHKGRPGVRS